MDTDQMTFEDLSAVYRTENKSQILSDVRRDLYPSLIRLQDSIKKEYESEFSRNPDSIICEGLSERKKKAAFFVQQVIDLRMAKIARMAVRVSMGAESIIDKLTAEEKEYYESVIAGSKKLRATAIKDPKRYIIPDIAPDGAEKKGTVRSDISKDGRKDVPKDARKDVPGKVCEDAVPAEVCNVSEDITNNERAGTEDMIIVRILEDLPKIPGPDCDYDLRKEDIVRMPATFANALIKHEKAVRLDVTP